MAVKFWKIYVGEEQISPTHNFMCVKPGSQMPSTNLGQRCCTCEHLSLSHNFPGIDRRLACEVELSSSSQAKRRLSAMKIIYVNIICGDLRRYVWRNNSIFPSIPDFKMAEESVGSEDAATLRTKYDTGRDLFALEALAAPSTFFEFSSSPTSSFFLHISSQGREEVKTGTPAGRFDPYLRFAPVWVRQRSIADALATH